MDTALSDNDEPLLLEDEQPDSTTDVLRQPSCFRKWVTVEPCLILYFMGSIYLTPLTDQYVLHFIQTQNNFSMKNDNGSECVHNTSDPNYIQEQEIQSQASKLVILFSVVALVPSLFATTQLGGYSDKVGRKVALLCALVGAILRCLISALVVYFTLPLHVFIAATLADGLLGGMSTFVMASFAYVADVTTHEERSFRIFILEVSVAVGVIISSIGTGYLIKALGFLYPLLILSGIHVLNLLYIVTILRESLKKDLTAQFFTAKYYISLMALYFRDDGKGRRWKLLLNLLILFLFCIPQEGGNEIVTFFQLDSPICFNSVDIGLWMAARNFVVGVSGVIALKLFHYRLGDMGLLVMGCVFSIIFFIWLAFIKTKLMMYLVTIAAMFSTLGVPMVRTISSKIVQPNEQGTMFSAIGIVQSISIPVASVTWNNIYAATVQSSYMTGTTFLVQAGMMAVCLLLIIVLIVGLRIEKKHQTPENEQHT